MDKFIDDTMPEAAYREPGLPEQYLGQVLATVTLAESGVMTEMDRTRLLICSALEDTPEHLRERIMNAISFAEDQAWLRERLAFAMSRH